MLKNLLSSTMQEVSISAIEPVNDGCATPEEPEHFNRMKAPPVCVDLSMKQESMSTEVLRQWIFPDGTIFPASDSGIDDLKSTTGSAAAPILSDTGSSLLNAQAPGLVVSVSSNNSSSDSYNLSSDETSDFKLDCDSVIAKPVTKTPVLKRDVSERLNAKVLLRTTSRHGRSSQRWVSGASFLTQTNIDVNLQPPAPNGESNSSFATAGMLDPVIRLVTGCVPILQSGKILFVSASRKAAWILPKGGWEEDESMEESAIRECFEEAGCIGTLGNALSSIQYETRKAKKRRVENLNTNEKIPSKAKLPDTFAEAWMNGSKIKSIDKTSASSVDSEIVETTTSNHSNDNTVCLQSIHTSSNPASPAIVALPSDLMTRIPQLGGVQTDTESVSGGSTLSGAYTHVQMTLFPLYVQRIQDDWPEKGRFRKAVHIDDAIKMMDGRPELQTALIEVRDRNLHIVPSQLH